MIADCRLPIGNCQLAFSYNQFAISKRNNRNSEIGNWQLAMSFRLRSSRSRLSLRSSTGPLPRLVSLRVWCVEVTQFLGLQYECCRNRGSRTRTITAAFDNHRHRQLRTLKRCNAKKPAVNAWILLIHYCLFVFANDVAAIVSFYSMPGLRSSRFWIVNRNNLLRRSCLASSVNASGFNRTEYATSRPA